MRVRAARVLGEAGAVTCEDTLGITPDFAGMMAKTVEHNPILPGGDADEVLQILVANVQGMSDGLAGLAGEVGEFALEDELSVEALLAALEEGEVTLQERLETFAELQDLFGGKDSVLKHGLGVGMLQNGQRGTSMRSISPAMLFRAVR